jgi:hypothetical protein
MGVAPWYSNVAGWEVELTYFCKVLHPKEFGDEGGA